MWNSYFQDEGSIPSRGTNQYKYNNMKSRNISLTLEKAKEWYDSGSSDLKKVALQAYAEDELRVSNWQNVKTFEDACYELKLHPYIVINKDIRLIEQSGIIDDMKEHLIAVYKLDIIRKALNKGWEPNMTESIIYYPYVNFYPAGKQAEEAARRNGYEVKETFKTNGKKYSLVGGSYDYGGNGIGAFGYEYGDVLTHLGLLGCKSREIAQHMSRYFAKEIFEACYAHHVGVYEWVI